MPEKLKVTPTHWVLILALLAAAYACYLLITPYINSIVMAFIISLLIYPAHQKLQALWPKRKNTIAFVSNLTYETP